MFELGQVVITSAATDKLTMIDVLVCLNRHMKCDHGSVYDDTITDNKMAIQESSGSVYSLYNDTVENTFYIITDFNSEDGIITTILLPEEY